MNNDDVAIRKRAQIAKANRTMFLWVAGASVVTGFAAVVSVFLFQTLVFNEKVLAEKANTVSTLDHNLSVVGSLEDEVRALNSNSNLIAAKANDNDDALQVILDALPTTPNSLALGASLQSRLLAGIDGLTEIEQLQVVSMTDENAVVTDAEATTSEVSSNVIPFDLTVIGSTSAVREVLSRFERSIRTIDIVSLKIESRGDQQALIVSGRAFYEPEKTIELKEIEVKP